MSRRSYLLLLLAAVLAIAVVDYWPEPKAKPPIDYETLTIAQLIAGMSGEHGAEHRSELRLRGWRDGPEVLEALFSHQDADVRAEAVGLSVRMNAADASDGMAMRWRDRVLRTLAEDADVQVREAAVSGLAFMVREELLAEAPPALMVALRGMMAAEADRSRFAACLAAWWLGEHAVVLVEDLLGIDTRCSDGSHRIKFWVCTALGSMGMSNESVRRYLLDLLRDPHEDVRSAAASALGSVSTAAGGAVEPLLARWRDKEESSSVRIAAVGSLAELAIERGLARDLLREVLPSRDLFGLDMATWVACVADFAVRVEDSKAEEAAVQVLRDASRHRYLQDLEGAVPGAIARIAAVLADPQLLQEVLPALLVELEDTGWTLEHDLWLSLEEGRKLAFEGLVDICRWRNDASLREAVRTALEAIGAHERKWTRKWTIEQLARLDQ